MTITLKPGTYYVGDPCYVLHDRWNEFCEKSFAQPDGIDHGDITLDDGTRVVYFSTKYGDGRYADQYGHKYPVDSGLIGIVLKSDIAENELEECKSGVVWGFAEHVECDENDGVIRFSDIFIDTGDIDEDEDDYDYEDEDE